MTDQDSVRYCPNTAHGLKKMRFIEVCNDDESERKTSWTCDCCENIVNIVDFKRD